MKSDYQYSTGIAYNNFPWPDPTDAQCAAISAAGQKVLDGRTHFPDATLADLYDPATMPAELARAHRKLDKEVDSAYGKRGYKSEAERVAFLFDRYQALSSPLDVLSPAKAKARRKASKDHRL